MGKRLTQSLGLTEAVALSLSMIGPTMAMAFNVTLAVAAAGRSAPLAFAIGTAVLAIVGISFVAFSRRVASAGSVYAYIALAFGQPWGFMSCWALLLTYTTYSSGTAALAGNFVDQAFRDFGLTPPHLWLAAAALATVAATMLAYRDMQIAARVMLAMEALSVLVIISLCAIVLHALPAGQRLSAAPFLPDSTHHRWSGVGFALVYTVLSFAGFEGATTLAEETQRPLRNIPLALIGTVLLAGSFFVFVSYVQVMGYGLEHTAELAAARAPLNALALKFASRGFAALIDVAAMISAFSCSLGSLSAAARLLFAMGRAGLVPSLGQTDEVSGAPARAVLAVATLGLLGVLLWAPIVGATRYYGYVTTIGTLTVILVYVSVTAAMASSAYARGRIAWASCGLAGSLLLLWPLYNSVYPVPAYPYNLWPYVAIVGLAIGALAMVLRPAVMHTPLDAGGSGLDRAEAPRVA